VSPSLARSHRPRRTLLNSAVAGAAGYPLPRVACDAAPVVLASDAADRRFSVLYMGDGIGAHTVSGRARLVVMHEKLGRQHKRAVGLSDFVITKKVAFGSPCGEKNRL
jgi:hypothetical protein